MQSIARRVRDLNRKIQGRSHSLDARYAIGLAFTLFLAAWAAFGASLVIVIAAEFR